MRIAYLIHQDIRGRFGGSEVYAGHLARAAVAAGHTVLAIFPGDGAERGEVDGVRVAVLDRAALARPRARVRFRESFDNPRALRLLRGILTDFAPDWLHVHHVLLTSARIMPWARRRGIAVTATLHDYFAFCHRITWQLPDGTACPGPAGGLRCRGCGKETYNRFPGLLAQPLHAAGFVYRNRLLRGAYRAADAVFAPSEAVRDAHRAHGFAGVALRHQPYGLPPAERWPASEGRDVLVVGYLGRLAPEKGLEILIDAARTGKGFAVAIFGEGETGYVASLRERAAGAPVTFHGPYAHGDLEVVLKGVDLVAAPSVWRENQPLALLEAAQRGVPILVADRGGLPETARRCGGRIVSPHTADAWSRVLTDAAADRAAYRAWREGTGCAGDIAADFAVQVAAVERAR